jgi:hypothetical protein
VLCQISFNGPQWKSLRKSSTWVPPTRAVVHQIRTLVAGRVHNRQVPRTRLNNVRTPKDQLPILINN